MSKSANLASPKVQKVCTLWTHETQFSREDVVINLDRFPELSVTPGTLVKIVALSQNTAVRDFQEVPRSSSQDGGRRIKLETTRHASSTGLGSQKNRHGTFMVTLDENGHRVQGGREIDAQKTYVFIAKTMSQDLKAKYPNLQVSISDHIARNFGFRNRMQVVLSVAEDDLYSASHIEISFRDEYLSRADMWRFAISELSGKTVYKGQKLLFMGTIKGTVKNVFVNGKTTHSAYFSTTTKPIFRSESARFVLFIQMSKEMWNFDTEGSGEIMFNKVINGFLPDLFKRWKRLDVKHLVSIILFTRMQYDRGFLPDNGEANGLPFDPEARDGRATRDFYRVVVSEMASGDWVHILYQLKKECRAFLRDVSIMPFFESTRTGDDEEVHPETIIAGTPRTADKGNVLEAINLAVRQYSKDHIDRDLVRTGISVIVITPGTGLFEVDYNMLKLTTDILMGSGIGIDLVCLQPMPLHSVPLFKYRNPRLATTTQKHFARDEAVEEDDTPRQTFPNFGPHRSSRQRGPGSLSASPGKYQAFLAQSMAEPEPGKWSYAMPHWLDISFWTGSSKELNASPAAEKKAKSQKRSKGFSLRCRMYELQMVGVMENELSNISVPYLQENPLYPWSLLAPLDEGADQKKTPSLPASSSPSDTRLGIYRSKPLDLDAQNAMQRAWMDIYDDHIFRPLVSRQQAEDEARKVRQQKELEARQVLRSNRFRSIPSESLLSASFTSETGSMMESARPPRSPGFSRGKDPGYDTLRSSRHMRHRPSISSHTLEESPPLEELPQSPPKKPVLNKNMTVHPLLPVSSKGSKKSDSTEAPDEPETKTESSRPPTPERGRTKEILGVRSGAESSSSSSNPRISRWFPRNMSFSAFGFGPSKAAPSTGINTNKNVTGSISKVTPTTSLARKPSQFSVLSAALGNSFHEIKLASEPIEIQNASKKSSNSNSAESSLQIGSGTPKGRQSLSTSHSQADLKDPGSLFLLAGSKGLLDQVGPKINLSSSGGRDEIPRTLSPTNALAPWMILVNPCNPKKNNLNVASQFRRWHHVFPQPLKADSMKWKSLCSPAAVPLTNDFFPTAEQLATEYNESPYRLIQNDEDEPNAPPKSRENLLRELIGFRLCHGFQIIIGSAVAEFAGKSEQEISNIFAKDYMLEAGSSVFMSIGGTVHQLMCISSGEVEVKRFMRKPTVALSTESGSPPFVYKPLIRTALDETYNIQEVPLKPPGDEYNWNFIDSYLAGYGQEFTEALHFWRARFVLLPIEVPTKPRVQGQLSTVTEDSDEEIRLEGIRKLTQIWQKLRYVSPEERQVNHADSTKKDSNPLAINFQTRDPSAVVAGGLDGILMDEGNIDTFSSNLFAGTESYTSSNYDLSKLAAELQSDKGIPMADRRWHFKLHLSCFVGFDLTTWILQNFRDIETREDAVLLGNQLMAKGLFRHVTGKHPFRDGNFFYHLTSEYRAPRYEKEGQKGWLGLSMGGGGRRTEKSSVPSTPSTDAPRPVSIASSFAGKGSRPPTATSSNSNSNSNSASERESQASSASCSASGDGDGDKTPTRLGSPRKSVCLSNTMRIDVDIRKRSFRPEIATLHYDRLHNPDNCYHIRIDWMNVTSKLIDDAITTWGTAVEKYGLRLVEVPIAEATSVAESHPFRKPYVVKLAMPPPKNPPQPQYFDATSFGPHPNKSGSLTTDKHVYHKGILRKFGFVLDMEAASCFPTDVDVTYSWGRPSYKYTQFVHKSGVVIAQITDEGTFLLLANRLCNSRGAFGVGLARNTPKHPLQDAAPPPPPPIFGLKDQVTNFRSPFASPAMRPVSDAGLPPLPPLPLLPNTPGISGPGPGPSIPNRRETLRTAEAIKDEMELLTSNEDALRRFYTEFAAEISKQQGAGKHSPRMSPWMGSIFAAGSGRDRFSPRPSPSFMARERESPWVGSVLPPPISEERIPSLRLPPGVAAKTGTTVDRDGKDRERPRDGSPASGTSVTTGFATAPVTPATTLPLGGITGAGGGYMGQPTTAGTIQQHSPFSSASGSNSPFAGSGAGHSGLYAAGGQSASHSPLVGSINTAGSTGMARVGSGTSLSASITGSISRGIAGVTTSSHSRTLTRSSDDILVYIFNTIKSKNYNILYISIYVLEYTDYIGILVRLRSNSLLLLI
ncbi:hypothetical protein IWZ03DRAFT_432603 [Phyllosticta citriasiana]|uniref:Vacuolar membrane-associated protein IML1 n=1 Tax=Phyllosticta citriasiana TaxID=595635 RepID=A0ABR1KAR9_9PEZI